MIRFVLLLIGLLSDIFCPTSDAQPRAYHAGEILLMLKKLNTLGSVLYIAAHPDDENTRMITYFTKKENLNVAYLSLTRGEGGQNLMGTEQGDLLGLIRTEELLAARRIDGGTQCFTRAPDFGFSKTHTETLQQWNENEILEDMVFVIRYFKPDIIITRFPPLKYNYDTHGHHSASAYLSEKAFDMAADPAAFSEQMKPIVPSTRLFVNTWQAKRLYWNTSSWFYQSMKTQMDTAGKIKIDVGAFIPELGESVTEIAARSRSMHKSQGFGAAEQRGSEIEYLEFVKGVPARKNLFEDIDITWSRVKGSERVALLLKKAYDEFDIKRRDKILPYLLEAYELLAQMKDCDWCRHKSAELENVISAVCGLFLETTVNDYTAASGEMVKIKTIALNRSAADVKLLETNIFHGPVIKSNTLLRFNIPHVIDTQMQVPSYVFQPDNWRVPEKAEGKGAYELISRTFPVITAFLSVFYRISINGVEFEVSQDIQHKWTDRVKGELYRPFVMSPDVTIHPAKDLLLIRDENPAEAAFIVKACKDSVSGYFSVDVSESSWNALSEPVALSFFKKGDEREVKISIIPPKEGSGRVTLYPEFSTDDRTCNAKQLEITYDHIPYQLLFTRSKTRVVKLDLKTANTDIAYIMGPGDEVDKGLKLAGYNVTYLTRENFSTSNLTQFSAILIGIRAYNTEKWLPHQKEKLMEYVKNGGNLIVQYQTTAGLLTNDFGPYPFKIGRGRVTVEEAPMTMLDPKHPLFNYPNKLTEKDFEGWVQERGLYFASEWDDKYVPLFSCADPGENELKGSMLLAQYGKGAFMYTGISFFRQLPAGVPGAYRLLANMMGYKPN